MDDSRLANEELRSPHHVRVEQATPTPEQEEPARSIQVGVVEPLTTSPEPRGGAAVRFLTPGPGRVVELTGVDVVRADPAFVDLQLEVEPGDEVPLLTHEDEVGHVTARGTTATEAIAHGRRLAAAIHVRTEPVA